MEKLNLSKYYNLVETCLDIFDDNSEDLTEEEVAKEIGRFLILKYMEKCIENGNVDIYNLELYTDGIKKYGNEKFLEYLEYAKFSKLVEYVKVPENESNIQKILDFLWQEILPLHSFKDYFKEKSSIKKPTTIKEILIALSLNSTSVDKFFDDITFIGVADAGRKNNNWWCCW